MNGNVELFIGGPGASFGLRHDGGAAAITYATAQRTYPLFVIDLANPAAPRQRGSRSLSRAGAEGRRDLLRNGVPVERLVHPGE